MQNENICISSKLKNQITVLKVLLVSQKINWDNAIFSVISMKDWCNIDAEGTIGAYI